MASSDISLSGRVALVTGGLTGIGLETAKALADAGASVAAGSLAADARSYEGALYSATIGDEQIAAARKSLEQAGVPHHLAALDVTKEESVRGFHADAIAALGPIDILVNAAGVGAKSFVADITDETWETAIAVNLTGMMRTIRCCYPGMAERGWGRIVNIGSTAANNGMAGSGAYCASKSGILGLSRCVAKEGAPHGVTCNVVNPGYVRTAMSTAGIQMASPELESAGGSLDERFDLAASTSPQGRLIEAEEIAAMVLYLCSDAARGVNNENITVSGGATW